MRRNRCRKKALDLKMPIELGIVNAHTWEFLNSPVNGSLLDAPRGIPRVDSDVGSGKSLLVTLVRNRLLNPEGGRFWIV